LGFLLLAFLPEAWFSAFLFMAAKTASVYFCAIGYGSVNGEKI
jgi:hypothetical protein